jgi:membrane-associated phospholipid phosphatase
MPHRSAPGALRRERHHIAFLALVAIIGITAAGIAFLYLDQPLCEAVHSRTLTPLCQTALRYATYVGNWQLAPLIVAILLLASGRHWQRLLKTVAAAYLVRTALVEWLKLIIGRPRPRLLPDATVFEGFGGGSSFPSGHASFSFMIALIIAAWFPRWRWPAWIIAVLISLSRILSRAHFMSDVIVGAAIGIVAAGLFLWIWPPVTDETREAIEEEERRHRARREAWAASFEGQSAMARSRRRAMATLIVVLFIAGTLISYWFVDRIPGFCHNAFFEHPVMQTLGAIGRHLGTWDLAPLLLAIALLAAGGRWRRLLLTVVAGFAVQTTLTEGIKELVGRPRPSQLDAPTMFCGPGTNYHSFPSGHASFIFVFCTICAHYFPQARWPLMALAVFVAASRVVVAAHYPSDVVFGALIGVLSGWLVLAIWPPAGPAESTVEGPHE